MTITDMVRTVGGVSIASDDRVGGAFAGAPPSVSIVRGSMTTYRNVDDPNVSVREGVLPSDWDWFRPNEKLPSLPHDIQQCGLQAYRRFPLVRSVIDLMADFVTKGMRVTHKSPRIQRFGRVWAKKVKMRAVAARIARMLFRTAAAPVQRNLHTLNERTIRELRAVGAGQASRLPAGQLPFGYVVLSPVNVDPVQGELAPLIGEANVTYGVRLPRWLTLKIQRPRTPEEAALVSLLPGELVQAAQSNEKLLLLPPDRTVVLHYRKDDSDVWGSPILEPLFDDLQMLQRLKLADRAALDGALSHVRLWKLGNMEQKTIPSPAAVARLRDMLLHNAGGGVMDLIWGPDIELVETSTDLVKFLGSEKYAQTLSAIYNGLGIPPTLAGDTRSGLTNNVVSLKVMLERLAECRDIETDFWLGELEMLQEVWGFREPFGLEYSVPSLVDDSAEKKLLIELIDRDIASPEFVLERFGADPELELARTRWYQRQRERGKAPPKAGPYHDDSRKHTADWRYFVQTGDVAPSQVGVEFEPKKPGDKTPNERGVSRKLKELAAAPSPAGNGEPAPPSQDPGGRPHGAKDNVKRKSKRVAVKDAVSALSQAATWAEAQLERIESLLPPFAHSRPGMGLLALGALCQLRDVEPTVASVVEALAAPVPEAVAVLYGAARDHLLAQGQVISAADDRRIRARAYALWATEV